MSDTKDVNLDELDPDEMINMHLLVTPGMGMPDSITVPEGMDFGQLELIVNGDMGDTVRGWHVVARGRRADMYTWLGKFDGFWKGNGVPMMEKFEVIHFTEKVYNHFKQYATTGN